MEVNCDNFNRSDINTLFFGSKYFWRSRDKIEIRMVKHLQSTAIEVDFFDPIRNINGPKLYLNGQLLESKLNHEKFVEDFAQEVELLNRNKSDMDREELAVKVKDKLIVDFILNRVGAPVLTEQQMMSISLTRDDDIIMSESEVLSINLIPVEAIFIPATRVQAMNALFEEVEIKAMSELKQANVILEEATRLDTEAINTFLLFMEKKKKDEVFSKPVSTWRKAYKRIAFMNAVRKTVSKLKIISGNVLVDECKSHSFDDSCIVENTGSHKLLRFSSEKILLDGPSVTNCVMLPPLQHKMDTTLNCQSMSNIPVMVQYNDSSLISRSVSNINVADSTFTSKNNSTIAKVHSSHINGLKLLRKSKPLHDLAKPEIEFDISKKTTQSYRLKKLEATVRIV
eukprot:gene13414-17988_t